MTFSFLDFKYSVAILSTVIVAGIIMYEVTIVIVPPFHLVIVSIVKLLYSYSYCFGNLSISHNKTNISFFDWECLKLGCTSPLRNYFVPFHSPIWYICIFIYNGRN
jgi:hypothetical protein